MVVDSGPTTRRPAKTLADLLIVDADVHVHESPVELAPYCDPPWDVALRTVRTSRSGISTFPASRPAETGR